MALWFVLALMTVVAAFAVLWPLSRVPRAAAAGRETLIYKDQLSEIERDRAAGLIPAEAAEAARVEVSRRLLSSATHEDGLEPISRPGLRRAVAVIALLVLPLLSGAMYLWRGSPSLPSFPLAARPSVAPASASLDTLVAQVETHLEKNPTDGRGWQVLAPVLLKLGRHADAVRAYRNSIAYNGENAVRRADLGEAIAAASGGIVTAEARSEFERALALDPAEAKARYFSAVAAQQDGDAARASAIWRDMLKSGPADAPWRKLVETALAQSGAVGPELSGDTIAAARDMNEAERAEMVGGMVERLAQRLRANGDDIDGWVRLVRAYMVMGQSEKAKQAAADARQAIAGNPDRLRVLNDALKTLGLEG
jgi:cytochrome c-type biogenesis protein CcmH